MTKKAFKEKNKSKLSTSTNPTKWRTQFRSNLTKVITLLKRIPLRQVHVDLLQTTPFYNFFAPFIAGEVTPAHVISSKPAVEAIVRTFNKEQNRFLIGGKELQLEPEEFDSIFGITSGSQDIDMKTTALSANSMGKRLFSDVINIYPSTIKGKLKATVDKNSQRDIEDTVKLIIVHALAFIFFVATQEVVRNWMFRLVEDLCNLHQYNWGKCVMEQLVHFIHTSEPQNQLLSIITRQKFNL